MKYLLCLLLFLLIPITTVARDLNFTMQPGDLATLYCPAGSGDLCVPLPGNAHGVTHPGDAYNKDLGYKSCVKCHVEGGDAITTNYVTLCSQFDFYLPGIEILDPRDGSVFTDPINGTKVVTGGPIAGYLPGSTVLCWHCHNPHNTAGPEPEKRDIHPGCLDCHRNVGGEDNEEHHN